MKKALFLLIHTENEVLVLPREEGRFGFIGGYQEEGETDIATIDRRMRVEANAKLTEEEKEYVLPLCTNKGREGLIISAYELQVETKRLTEISQAEGVIPLTYEEAEKKVPASWLGTGYEEICQLVKKGVI